MVGLSPDPIACGSNLGIIKNFKCDLLNGLKGQVACSHEWMTFSLYPHIVINSHGMWYPHELTSYV
jgi:hypothetical protein